MREADPPHVRSHKSSHSSASGQCVEVAPVAGAVAVRDSKDPAGPELVFTRQALGGLRRRCEGGPGGAVTAGPAPG